MASSNCDTEYVYSSLGDDPDLGEIVTEFVSEMPDKIRNLEQLAAAADWESLRRSAHQLKGAAGSYGFDRLTEPAAQLEVAAGASVEEDILQKLEQMVALCRRVQSGAP